MPTRQTLTNRAAAIFAAVLMLAACGVAAAPAPTAAPTPTPTSVPTPSLPPTPTPPPLLAERVFVAGVSVGGTTPAVARTALEQRLAPLLRPLEIRAGRATLSLRPDDIGLQIDYDTMLGAALSAGAGEKIPLSLTYDRFRLRALVEDLAPDSGAPPKLTVITSSEPISRSFALAGGQTLDVDAAVKVIDERLWQLSAPRRITLPLAVADDVRPTPAQLQEQLRALAGEWKGVAGVYVYDIASGQEVASVNQNTVFHAASTIKIAIMLNAYAHLDQFTPRQERALRKMIVESDNIEANLLLAASVGGVGTEEAIVGAEQMSAMLADLGLEHTYQYVPYEASDYIRINKLKVKSGPRDPVGEAPYTETGRWLRATPAEMAQVYIWIEQCSRGEGTLAEAYPETLTPARCEEMIARLEQNADTKRMVAGLPSGTRVAHKSGWIPDMQADVGMVRSPGGDYIVAIYLYRPLGGNGVPVPDRVMMSAIAGFSRLVYTYYNPVVAPH